MNGSRARPLSAQATIPGLLERLATGALLGLLAGAALGAYDVLAHGAGLDPGDLAVALILASLPGAVLLAAVAAALAVAAGLLGWRPRRSEWAGLLAAVCVVALAAALVLVGTQAYRDARGLALVLASVPVAAFVFGLAVRLRLLDEPGRALVVVASGLAALVVAAGGITARRAAGAPLALDLLSLVAALGVAGLGVALGRRAPWIAGIALGLGAVAATGYFAVSGGRVPEPPAAASASAAAARPNVVLVVLDTTRRDRLGCYGHPGGLTPALDRIAAEGAVYETAIGTSPWTIPSHASLFTGLYPLTHGCSYAHRLWLEEDFVTLAEMLGASGYRTAALYSNDWIESANTLQGFDTRVPLERRYGPLALKPLSVALGAPARWCDKGATEGAVQLARWLAETREPGRPFFLFVNLLESHGPYVPPLRDRAASCPDGIGLLRATRYALGFQPWIWQIEGRRDAFAERLIGAMYDAEIRHQDRALGRILDLLRRHTPFEDTLLIITSDHGENLGEAGRWDHVHEINEVLLHVPLVVRYPRLFPAGTRVAGLCQTVDVVPTVLELTGAGGEAPELPGRTLVPERFVPYAEAFAEVAPFYGQFAIEEAMRFNAHRSVLRTARLKYVRSSDGRHALYDLDADPLETENLVEARPEVAADLEARLARWREAQPAFVPRPGSTAPRRTDAEERRRLRALGYIP